MGRPHNRPYHLLRCPPDLNSSPANMRQLKAEMHEARGTVGLGRGIAQKTPNKGCPTLNEEYALRAEFPQRLELGQTLAFPK